MDVPQQNKGGAAETRLEPAQLRKVATRGVMTVVAPTSGLSL
jgi:hypothetical protein